MDIKKNIAFNNTGQKLTIDIQLRYDELKVFEYPPNCYLCPAGFSGSGVDCGRNIPFEQDDMRHRPKTCKLVKINPFNLESSDSTNIKELIVECIEELRSENE